MSIESFISAEGLVEAGGGGGRAGVGAPAQLQPVASARALTSVPWAASSTSTSLSSAPFPSYAFSAHSAGAQFHHHHNHLHNTDSVHPYSDSCPDVSPTSNLALKRRGPNMADRDGITRIPDRAWTIALDYLELGEVRWGEGG